MLTLRILVFSGGPECPLSLPSLFLSSLFGSSSFYSKKNVFLQQARVTYNDGTLIKELCLSAWHLGMSASHFIAFWLAEEGPAQCGSFLSGFPGYLCENSELAPWDQAVFPLLRIDSCRNFNTKVLNGGKMTHSRSKLIASNPLPCPPKARVPQKRSLY